MGKWTLVRAVCLTLSLLSCGVQAADPEKSVDPWEGFNRKMFAFNDTLDSYLLKPLAKGYRAVTPDVVEGGVSNVFDNLFEIRNLFNELFQGKLSRAGVSGGRFLVNSTLGLAGIFDVAKHMGLEETTSEDFGQTLSVWGVGQGPYLVIPFLGPSTVRDAFGLPVNSVMNPVRYVDHVPTRNTLYGTDLIDTRSALLDAEVLLSGDKYIFTRDAYLQRRNYLITDGAVVEDQFGQGDDF